MSRPKLVQGSEATGMQAPMQDVLLESQGLHSLWLVLLCVCFGGSLLSLCNYLVTELNEVGLCAVKLGVPHYQWANKTMNLKENAKL